MNILLTGGTGFIGSYVVHKLVENKCKVTLLARNLNKIPFLKKIPEITLKKFDLKHTKNFKIPIGKYDALILIALGWGDTGPEMIKNETLPQIELIDSAIKSGIKKIIFTSSTAALGPIFKTSDETSKLNPSDFYGATKASVEMFLFAYSNYHKNMSINIIRPGYTFGNPIFPSSPMEPDSRFRDIVKKVKQNKFVNLIKNDGTQFIYAGDLAEIYIAILKTDIKNEVFLGLSENFITWEQIAKWTFEFYGKKPKIKLKDLGWSDNPPLYSVKKIKKFFNFSFNSEEKIKNHIKYLLSNI